jgi:hypothetical protein
MRFELAAAAAGRKRITELFDILAHVALINPNTIPPLRWLLSERFHTA